MDEAAFRAVIRRCMAARHGELTESRRCGRSSVDRIAHRAGLHRLCLGTGRNGMVRYIRKEVEAYEVARQV